MALSRDIVIRLLGDAKSAVDAQKAAADAAGVAVGAYRKAEREHERLAKATETAARKQREAMESVGRGTMLMGAAIVAGLGLAARAAINWETAWAGVRKTVDGTPKEMAALEASLRSLATQLPATHDEIAGVAEAAGQLGIARGDIVEFTKVAIAMGVSTNLSAEDAATGLARLSNIMGTSSQDVDRMGSALVALGNAGASTEGEILDMALRIAAAGRQSGLTEGEVMGLANAMSSLGIEAEAGGTAISTVIKSINNSVMDGGESLEAYAEIAGTTAVKFGQSWRKDAAGALTTVIEGLARMQARGENVNAVINDLGLGGIRTSDTLLRLAGDADGLAASLANGNQAWAENSALMNEANQRYETTAARLQMARNQINDAAIDIGGTFLPVVAEGAEMVANLSRGFQELPGPLKEVVVVLGLAAGSLGLVGGAALVAAPKVAAFRAIMHTLEGSTGGVQRNMGRFGLFMTGPWGAAIGAGTVVLGGLIAALGASSRASEEAATYQRDLASALRETGGVIDDNVREMAALEAEEAKFQNASLLEWAERVGVAVPKVTDALLGNKDAYGEISEAIDAYAQSQLDAAVAAGTADNLDLSWVPELKARYEGLSQSMGGAVAENERLAAAASKTGEAAGGSVSGIESATAAAGGFGAQAGLTAEEIEEWIGQLSKIGEAFVTPLNTYKGLLQEKQAAERESAEATAAATKSSSDSWEDYVTDVTVSLDEYATKLEEEITAQENWRKNVVTVTQRGGMEIGQILATMGVEGAQITSQMASATTEDFERMKGNLIREAELGGAGAAAALDREMVVMEAIGKRGAKATASGIARELGIGVDEVARIASQYGVTLASGINPLLAALGKNRISGVNGRVGGLTEADGGVVDYYANGGVESHTAQIAPAGAWRVWAEPETGGEAYIPLSPGKRARSLDIWRETGKRLGAAQAYAFGGINDVPRPSSTAPYRPPVSTAGDSTMQKAYDETTAWLQANLEPTYSGGGTATASSSALVAFGRYLQSMGVRVGEHPAFGGVAPVHTRNSKHYSGRAIDINTRSGTSSAEQAELAPLVAMARARGFQTIFMAPGHYGHAHIASYETGTPYVPQDGLAYLHKGERVTPAEFNRPMPRTPVGAPVNVAAPVVYVTLDGRELRHVARVEAGDVVASHNAAQARNARGWQ